MRNIGLMLAGSLGAIALGLPYIYISIYRALGPAEAEFYDYVLLWGRVSLYTGIVLAILSLALGLRRARPFKLILGLGYSLLTLLQLPPIYGWFAGHGYGISDHPGSFVIHWRYGIPHVILLAIGAFILYGILRDLSYEGVITMRKWLLIAIIIYLVPGLVFAVWVQLRADPDDPSHMPVWAPGLSLGQRVMAALWMVPSVLLWPVFLPPTIYWCLIRGACG